MDGPTGLLRAAFPGREVDVRGRLKSRKNAVWLVGIDGRPHVAKLYSEEFVGNKSNEVATIREALYNGVNVPLLVYESGPLLVLDFVGGENACDLLNDPGTPEEGRLGLVRAIAEWLHGFHRLSRGGRTLLRGDSNLRNFILGDGLFGVDLEEAHPGDRVEDVGSICGSILETRPEFEPWKYELARALVDRYSSLSDLDMGDRIGGAIADFLEFKAGWRTSEADKRLLLGKVEELREHGLWD